jgi:hypothetical protein
MRLFQLKLATRFSWLAFILLTGCNSPPNVTPAPTAQTLTIAITPVLQPLGDALHRCAVAHPEIALIVNEAPASTIEDNRADLAFRLGEPPGEIHYAAPVAWDQVVVILHPDNPVESLTGEDLLSLFTGHFSNWKEVGGPDREVIVWVFSPGDETHQIFDAAILQGETVSSLALLAPNSAAMLEGISSDPAAIGYLPKAWLTTEVRTLQLDERTSSSLHHPVLALASAEPQGLVRTFLICLQSGEGQAEIKAIYN